MSNSMKSLCCCFCSWLKERFSPPKRNRTIVVIIVAPLLLLLAIWFVCSFYSAITSGKNILVHTVFIFGFVGGIMSMTQRYSKEKAVAEVAETKVKAEAKEEVAGKITLSDYIRSSIFGGVFAIILMLIFQGGLGATIGDVNLFPVYCMDYPITSSMEFFELLSCYPETGADVAKLLVWSFLAGFSERMVPGALGKLSSRIGSKT